MIKSIDSTLPSFKNLKFNKGLNIIVAERDEGTGIKGTRNGTGKTSIIELIHYLLAEKRSKDDDFHKRDLSPYSFSGVFNVGGSDRVIKKDVGETKDITFLDGIEWHPREIREEFGGKWFGLSNEISVQKYSPTFGALFSYFVRRARNDGFSSPEKNSGPQKSWDGQVNLAFLLGLDWQLPQSLQLKKDEKKKADLLGKMLSDGYLQDNNLDLNQMQSRLDILESEIETKRRDVTSATVVDDYQSHEDIVNSNSRIIKILNEENLADLELIDEINGALVEVEDAISADVQSMYNELGIYFSDQVTKRFSQVEEFHRKISVNRKTQLISELRKAKARIEQRRTQIGNLQIKLSVSLKILQSGIAAERITLLQSELNQLEAEKFNLETQIPKLRDNASEKKRLKQEIDEIVENIGLDVMQRVETRKLAVTTFANVSNHLYDRPGKLILGRSERDAGLIIDTDIEGKKSGGKNHMQVFCFDWTLTHMAHRHSKHPGFLIHDSHIFDGVDGRQIGLALKYANEMCEKLDLQYIVALNSDDLQKVRNEEEISGEELFDPNPYINPVKLSDQPNGGLFGIRF